MTNIKKFWQDTGRTLRIMWRLTPGSEDEGLSSVDGDWEHNPVVDIAPPQYYRDWSNELFYGWLDPGALALQRALETVLCSEANIPRSFEHVIEPHSHTQGYLARLALQASHVSEAVLGA